jgi:RNA polymerase-binding transcription factor DksA
MTSSELATFRKQLIGLQERLGGDISHLASEAFNRQGDEAHGNLSHMPIHMADLGTDNFEQENTLHLLAKEENLLKEIAVALDRIDKGKYGECEECHDEIAKARLKELPYTRYCVECARMLDKQK